MHKVKEFMEGKAAIPGATEQQQQQVIAPTPSMQPAANKVIFHYYFFFKFQILVLGSNESSK